MMVSGFAKTPSKGENKKGRRIIALTYDLWGCYLQAVRDGGCMHRLYTVIDNIFKQFLLSATLFDPFLRQGAQFFQR